MRATDTLPVSSETAMTSASVSSESPTAARCLIPLDALFSREIVTCMFTPPLPLHDGGAVVRNGRLASAHCIFPVSNNPALASSGMRHRAAVGLSEETDALVVVVSEESGAVSVAHNGRLVRYADPVAATPQLTRWVARALPSGSGNGSLVTQIQRWVFKFTKGTAK